MAAVRAALTEDDLRMLVKGPTADERALAAHKLCRAVDRDNLSQGRYYVLLYLFYMEREEIDAPSPSPP